MSNGKVIMDNGQLVPELRFPEFEEHWEKNKFANITSKIGSGKTPKGGEKIYQKSGVPFIRSQNVINDKLYLDETHISEKTHVEMKSSKVISNDILLNITGGSIGRSCVVPSDFDEGNVNQHVSIIRLIKDNPKFIQSFLSSYRGQKLIYQGQTGSGREGLNFESIKSFKIYLPPLKEQQKIANFLTAIDQRITLLKQKKAALEQYKKGLMQQIFSQEIRFKDDGGNDYPDWEMKKINQVFYEIKDKVGNREIKTFSITAGRGFVSQKEKFGKNISGQQNSKYIVLQPGDFSYNKGNSKTYKYGCIYCNLSNDEIAVPNVFISFRLIDKKMTPYFFEKLFEYHYLDRQLRRIISSSARMDGLLNVNRSSFLKLEIPVPSPSEQQKIADCLSAIDQSINQLSKQIDQTTQFKKGLLQRMFV